MLTNLQKHASLFPVLGAVIACDSWVAAKGSFFTSSPCCASSCCASPVTASVQCLLHPRRTCRCKLWTPRPFSSCGTLRLSSSSMASTRDTRYTACLRPLGGCSGTHGLVVSGEAPQPSFHQELIASSYRACWPQWGHHLSISYTGSETQIIHFQETISCTVEQVLMRKSIYFKIYQWETYLSGLESAYIRTTSSWKGVLSEEHRQKKGRWT